MERGKYSDYITGISMSTDPIENFRLEKATDPTVLKAIYTNRLREPFERNRKTPVDSRWGQSETDRKDIERIAKNMNRYRELRNNGAKEAH